MTMALLAPNYQVAPKEGDASASASVAPIAARDSGSNGINLDGQQ
jgi:hypothetical protein